jgi:hypothetical protein
MCLNVQAWQIKGIDLLVLCLLTEKERSVRGPHRTASFGVFVSTSLDRAERMYAPADGQIMAASLAAISMNMYYYSVV